MFATKIHLISSLGLSACVHERMQELGIQVFWDMIWNYWVRGSQHFEKLQCGKNIRRVSPRGTVISENA